MNHHAAILDCTLRDGAYLIDKNFGENVKIGITNGLMEARLDYIEIGFLQSEGYAPEKTIYQNAAQARPFVPKNKNGTLFTVLADYSRYDIHLLDEYTGDSFDAVRACFFKNERHNVIAFCKAIKEKGYRLFVQPVDILGYTDEEIIDLMRDIAAVEPDCVSIVDTFGSMYEDDLMRVFYLINHNLPRECKIGFHSHNNMQLSNALSQAFLRVTYGLREVVVDGTICGMGRGAGNTPTELIAQYMVSKLGYSYDIDAILDVIDTYMPSIKTRCSWGYTTPNFLAGSFSAHVNNIAYLTEKNCLDSKGIRYILNKIGPNARKRYDYDLLEKTYLEYQSIDVDDASNINKLKGILNDKNVVLLVPGPSIIEEEQNLLKIIEGIQNSVVISVNFIPEKLPCDFLFFSNVNRFTYWRNDPRIKNIPMICTSNIGVYNDVNMFTVSYKRLIKCGWDNMENATILILRLLDCLEVKSISIAGFDGYEYDSKTHHNYAQPNLELSHAYERATLVNREIMQMLEDYISTRKLSTLIRFITKSRFSHILKGNYAYE